MSNNDKTEFKKWIKDYIEIDNKLKTANQQISAVRKQKKSIECKISNFIVDNDLEDTVFNIPENGSLKLGVSSTVEPITKEYLYKKIQEILEDDKLTKECIDNIYNNRNKIEKSCIKRSKRQAKS